MSFYLPNLPTKLTTISDFSTGNKRPDKTNSVKTSRHKQNSHLRVFFITNHKYLTPQPLTRHQTHKHQSRTLYTHLSIIHIILIHTPLISNVSTKQGITCCNIIIMFYFLVSRGAPKGTVLVTATKYCCTVFRHSRISPMKKLRLGRTLIPSDDTELKTSLCPVYKEKLTKEDEMYCVRDETKSI